MPSATWSDIPQVRAVLARAYAEDPLMRWTFPDPAVRAEAVAAWLGLFAEAAMASGSVDLTRQLEVTGADGGHRSEPRAAGSGVSAVAVWRFPGEPAAQSESVPRPLPTVAGLLSALVGAQHARTVGAALAALRPLAPTGPSAYVQCLAVDPASQRRGLGRAVLAPGLSRAAAAGLGVHLETANPRALPFYDALGFHVTGEVELAGGGPRLWALTLPADEQHGGALSH